MTGSFGSLRLAVRACLRMRMTGAIAVSALAIGIGATTTMASVAYATLYRELPFPDASRLVILYNTRQTPRDGLVRLRWSFTRVTELRQNSTTFESLASFSSTSLGVRTERPATQIDGEVVSPEYFKILGAVPAAGRAFTLGDQSQPVVIISDRMWETHFGRDPKVIGSSIRISDEPVTVIGALPPGFRGLSGKAEYWLPTWMAPRLSYAGYLTSPQHFISVIARLRPGATIAQANAELQGIGTGFADEPRQADAIWGAAAVPASNARVDPGARQSVWLMFSAAACVLLIACVNVAALLVARARERRREMAIRLAIGASRRRLAAQLLTEGCVLGAIAGAAGTMMAGWGVRAVSAYAPDVIASGRNSYGAIGSFSVPAIDIRLLLFAIAATVGTAVICTIAPAFESSRSPLSSLREGDRGATTTGRSLPGLVVIEIALAVLLLAGAGLLVESLVRLQSFRAGFTADRVLTFWLRPPVSRYAPETGPQTIEKFLTAIEAVPGVESAAVNRCSPYMGCARTALTFTDRENDPQSPVGVGRHYVSARYFDTLGIPVLRGRGLTPLDRAGNPPVTVINETAARRFWPNENPIGKRVRFGPTTGFVENGTPMPVEIVGIVADVKYENAEQPLGPDFYTSYLQHAQPDTMVLVKARAGAAPLESALRDAVASVDPAVPLYEFMTLDERVGRAVERPRYNAAILAMFAAAAALLAALGIYGVLSFTVSSRLREIGVRLALGATPRGVLGLFVGQGVRLAAAGVLAGAGTALLLTRASRPLVADLGGANLSVLGMVSLFVLAVAAAAAFLPARRASAVDPIVVLRND